MIDDLLASVGTSAFALPVMFLLVLGDAFLVVIPGEAAVTAFGAIAAQVGSPPLAAVIAVAAVGAFCGDLACYGLGRAAGLDRWRWMRGPRVQRAFAWARTRLDRRMAVVLFTARFVPFARLAVNLTAGASRLPFARYAVVVGLAALGWAVYQAVIGAVVAVLVPGGPVVAVAVSVVVAVGIGLLIDVFSTRARVRNEDGTPRRRSTRPGEMDPS